MSKNRALLALGLLLFAFLLVLLVWFLFFRPAPPGAAIVVPAPVPPAELAPETSEVEVTIEAADGVARGSTIEVRWTGPNSSSDYLTVVTAVAPEGKHGNTTVTASGNPLKLLMPMDEGPHELRYMTGVGARVLARRPIVLTGTSATLTAASEVEAGRTIAVKWSGPGHAGDYLTIVPKDFPEGKYGNYVQVGSASPASLLIGMVPGEAELRYVSGQGAIVLGRAPITIVAAIVTLEAGEEAVAGSDVKITWTGPGNGGDYITIVPEASADGKYGDYRPTSAGAELTVKAPDEAGPAEVRYMSGQGGLVLKRRPILIR